jgi:hypothetical protein
MHSVEKGLGDTGAVQQTSMLYLEGSGDMQAINGSSRIFVLPKCLLHGVGRRR